MTAQTSTLIIINGEAARARRVWPDIKDLLDRSEVPFELYATKHAGDATLETRRALRAGYRTIAVVGGDGTLSEAAAGFFDDRAERVEREELPRPVNDQAALALLPAGTGDDFARGLLDGRRESALNWAMRLVAYCRDDGEGVHVRSVDAICGNVGEEAREFICLNAATIGIGAEVASGVAAQNGLVRRLPGEVRFVSAALTALVGWRERRATVAVGVGLGPTVIECTSNLIAVANGRYAGGGMMFAPRARLDDGLMDVVLASGGLTRPMLLRELPRIRRGAHLSNPRVRLMQATSVRVETPDESLLVEADGNVRGHTPVSFRIMPGALRVVQ